jgi:hypothetical protein
MLKLQGQVHEGGGDMEIPIKARVRCTDGPAGEATHVVVHPITKKVARLVVRETKSPHVERIVPFGFVEETAADEIRLRCSRQELSRMQSFVRTELVQETAPYYGRGSTDAVTIYRIPGFRKVKHLNIPEGEVAMDHGTRVRASDGKAGRIDRLMVDPMSGSLTHLVVREGPVWASKAVPVPIAEVKRMDNQAVYLRTNRAGIEALPAIRP